MAKRKRRRKLKTSVKITALVLIVIIAFSGYLYYKIQQMRSYTEPEGTITDTNPKDNEGENGKISPIGGDEEEEEETSLLTYKVYDLEQGEAILVKTDEKVVLIDTGSKKSKKELVKKVEEDTAGEIDYLIFTADDPDKLGGMKAIKKNFTVKHIIYGDLGKNEEKVLKIFKDSEILDEKETTIDIGYSATVMTLMPKSRSTDKNDRSIICNVSYGDTYFWSMSNAGAAEEKKLVDIIDESISVFVPARRGDDTTNYILNVTEPTFVAIPLNRGDKVSEQFLNRCSSGEIYDTQKCGDLTFESDKNSVTMQDYETLSEENNLAK